MVESLHHGIDQLAGILVTLLGEMEIEHGGFQLGMAQVALDDAQIDAGLNQALEKDARRTTRPSTQRYTAQRT